MRRKAWIAIRNGVVLPNFYLADTLLPTAFCKPEEVQIVGLVNVEAPPPPTDMIPMGGLVVWVGQHGDAAGYLELLK